MINLFFFLKFKTQLRRTRPELVKQLEEFLTQAVNSAGGKITNSRSLLAAVFNEERIGIWLDIYILIENHKKYMESSADFFDYAFVICNKTPEIPEPLCRFLSGTGGGIFMDSRAVKKFIPYADFEKPSVWLKGRKIHKYGSQRFYKIKKLKMFKPKEKDQSSLHDDVKQALELAMESNGDVLKKILILGPDFFQVCLGVNKYCEKINGSFPPLKICFGSVGLGALVDAWSNNIRSLISEVSNEEIDSVWELLFRDRIRDEVSDFTVRSVRNFLSLLFKHYFDAARKKRRAPVIILENLNLAGKKVSDLLQDSLEEISEENKEKLLILGIAEDNMLSDKLQQWKSFFNITKKIDADNDKLFNTPRLTMDLWEIVYAVLLFGRYFSPELFQKLFEAEDKNPAMINRAFSIFYNLGIIYNVCEPWPISRRIEEQAKKILGDNTGRVKAMVRGSLLSWALRRNINPCFRLLTIVAALDGVKEIDDLLLLRSISSDIVNDTILGLETALKNGQLEDIVSVKRAQAVRCIFNTSRALYTGREHDIDKAFLETSIDDVKSDFDAFPVLKAQMIVNLCGYYFGRHNITMASEKAKEAILLGQSKNSFCIPQAYRLFSLVCLSKQQTAEAIEYLGFALSNAEKTGNFYELGISAYYAAAAQFLYGNIYNAAKLAQKSIEQSINAGRPEWADRSRFLEGRLQFELGNYKDALSIFENLHKNPFGSVNLEKDSLFASWIYRTKIYLMEKNAEKPEAGNHDADLFEIEAAYFAGDYEKAAALASSLENPFVKDNFLYTEQPNWSSGFSQCEHLYFSQGEIQDRMITLFHSLALSNLSCGAEAEQLIQKVLRDERLCEMDPWDAFYFYAKYRILEQTGVSLVDMGAAVSIAFKRLQRRASRIEDIETRRQYLNGHRWNRELGLAAKEFKLI